MLPSLNQEIKYCYY